MDDEPSLEEPELPDTPTQHLLLKRLAVFLRSVIPADPWQLAYLVGIVFVLILGALPMRPDEIVRSPGGYLNGHGPYYLDDYLPYMILCAWASLAASCVGFFTCLWPGPKPGLRIVLAVILPTVAVLALFVWKIYQLNGPSSSVLQSQIIVPLLHWLRTNAWRFPTGPYVGVCGLTLISIYAIRLATGRSSLPISVCPTGLATQEEQEYWRRVQWLLFMLFGLYILISQLIALPLLLVDSRLVLRLASSGVLSVITGVGRVIDAAVLLSLSLLILGKQGREAAIKSLRLPGPRYAMLAILFPVAIIGAPPAAEWAIDRIQWAQHDIGLFGPPQLSTYFDLDHAWQPWLLLMITGALAEEVIFRGVLLGRMIKRYGLQRGIFFTGVAWAMIHFRSDRYSGLNIVGVLVQLTFRVAFCVAMNYVLAWMTLRWKSIIPAGLAHAVWNMLVTSGLVRGFEWDWGLEIFLWTVLALVLWRYWPVESLTEDTAMPPSAPELVA